MFVKNLQKIITTFRQKKTIFLVNVHSNASVSSRLSTNKCARTTAKGSCKNLMQMKQMIQQCPRYSRKTGAHSYVFISILWIIVYTVHADLPAGHKANIFNEKQEV